MSKTIKSFRMLAVILVFLLSVNCMSLAAYAESSTYLDPGIIEGVEGLDVEDEISATEVIEAIESIESINLSSLTRASIAYVTDFASLKAAIADSGVSIIVLLADVQLEESLYINRDLTILAIPGFVITAKNQEGYLFLINGENITLTFSNVILDGGGGYCGIYSNASNLTLVDAKIKNCVANGEGGAIFAVGNLILEGGEFTNNNSYNGVGGAIFCYGTVTVNGATISGNSAVGQGGGIYANEVIVNSGLISGNKAGEGGGIFVLGTLQMYGGTISENVAYNGGGIYFLDYSVEQLIAAGEISDNFAYGDGGGILARNLDNLFVLEDVVFAGNAATTGYNLTDPVLIALHEANIKTTHFSEPFTQFAYNNYDISYTGGDPVTLNTVNYYLRLNDTEVYSTASVYSGQTLGAANMPIDPQSNGLVFVGWMDTDHKFYDANSIITGSVNLYACWMLA